MRKLDCGLVSAHASIRGVRCICCCTLIVDSEDAHWLGCLFVLYLVSSRLGPFDGGMSWAAAITALQPQRGCKSLSCDGCDVKSRYPGVPVEVLSWWQHS